MLLREGGEFAVIDRINNGLILRPEAVVQGVGDDCAVIRTDAARVQLVTNDVLVEHVDFLYERITPEQLGHKSLAANLSDIAAMGGTPEHAMVSLCVPDRYSVEYVTAFYEGMKRLASRFGVNIIGGDLSSAPHDLVVSVTAIGSAEADRLVYRKGAQPGDTLLLVGIVGESGAGLATILQEIGLPDDVRRRLLTAHLEPEPLVEEGRFLAESGLVRAMLDVSDGIASDVRRICTASDVGAVLDAGLIPITSALRSFLTVTGHPAERYSVQAGEDYALLFTTAPCDAAPLVEAFRQRFTTPIARIGTITGAREVLFRTADGATHPLSGGFEHFR